uniref:Uncharacterized protein n=1 Tax=Anguilla anguilla TaxID=7936 RepID=A0A0E9RF46_ANGAN
MKGILQVILEGYCEATTVLFTCLSAIEFPSLDPCRSIPKSLLSFFVVEAISVIKYACLRSFWVHIQQNPCW